MKVTAVGLGLVLLAGLAGCRPYNTPKYTEIKSNETAFMIPLEGDIKTQTKFQSVEFLNQNMIAAQRVEIPRRWVQKGYAYWSGDFIDT